MDLSIITVSYNNEALLRGCLGSVFENTHDIEFEFFVVDNHSREDDTPKMVREEFPRVKLIENQKNVGFARANNQAIERSTGRYVVLLNGDTTVLPHALDHMVGFLDTRPDAGVLGTSLTYPDGRDQGASARAFPTPMSFFFGRTTTLTKYFPHNRFSRALQREENVSTEHPYEVDWVSGACLMVRREAMDEVGVLDGDYFMYWEDTDWCLRIKQAGWKVFCFHEPNVMHAEAGSAQLRIRPVISFHRSAYVYYRKHLNPRGFHPMHPLAVLGLTTRAGLILGSNCLRRGWRSLRSREPTGPRD